MRSALGKIRHVSQDRQLDGTTDVLAVVLEQQFQLITVTHTHTHTYRMLTT